MVATTLVPVEVAAGFRFDNVQLVPTGAPTIAQPSGMLPVKPFNAFTSRVLVMFVPTLVATVPVLAVTEKSFTESVTLAERVTFTGALVPMMAMVSFAATRGGPNVVASVTME